LPVPEGGCARGLSQSNSPWTFGLDPTGRDPLAGAEAASARDHVRSRHSAPLSSQSLGRESILTGRIPSWTRREAGSEAVHPGYHQSQIVVKYPDPSQDRLIVLFGTLLSVTSVAAVVVGTRVLSEFIANFGLALSTYLITLVAGIILGPLWEEPGWRGFALPRLQSSYGPLLGTLILGALWALWHIPGYFGGWLVGSPMALLVSTAAFSVVMTWVYNNTRGSILLMILLQSSSSATLALGALVLPADMSASVSSLVSNGWIPALTYSLVAGLVILATRGRLSAKWT